MKYEFNVQYSDIVSLLELDPDVKKTFRYYEKRKKDSMKNHIVNFFLKEIKSYGTRFRRTRTSRRT